MDLDLLERLTNGFGPPGHEEEIQKIFKDYGAQFSDEVLYDKLGSVIHRLGSSGPKIMIAGHADEIGFVITEIEDSGYLKIHNLGGWWPGNIRAHQILIKPYSGGEKIIGLIVGRPPFGLSIQERNKVIPLNKLVVDIGCKSKKEVEELGIRIGDPAAPYAFFRTMKRSHISKEDEEERKETTLAVAKAFDNRIGIFIVLQSLKRIKEQNIDHPNQIFFVSTTQEEVGVRGAKTASNLIEPDIGFAIDVEPSGDAPEANFIQKMGNGVTISAGDSKMIPNPFLRKFVTAQAEKNDIKWQPAFLNIGTTDAAIIHLSGIGAPSLFVGVATRHIHSHQAMLDLEDVENAIHLMVQVLKNLDEKTVISFTELG